MKQTIYQMEQSSIEFKKTHTVNIGTLPKDDGNEPKLTLQYLNNRINNLEKRLETPPKYFIEFQNQMLQFIKEQREFNKQMLEFKGYVLDVFKRNNLFQKYVIDVFKRNNLK